MAVSAVAAAVVVSAGVSYYNGQEQKKAAEKASQQAQNNANQQATAAEQAFNKTNQKRPDTSAILSAASQSAKGGESGTMLTGPLGVNPNQLNLGKNTLLGQ